MASCNTKLAKPWSISEVKTLRATGLWPTTAITANGIMTVFSVTISASVANFNLLNYLTANLAYNGIDVIFVSVTISPSVAIYSTSPTQPAFTTGILPTGSLVYITGSGSGAAILGAGGTGGNGGGDTNTSGTNGGAGGTALYTTAELHIDCTLLQVIGGGGGGGGGGAYTDAVPAPVPPVPQPVIPPPPIACVPSPIPSQHSYPDGGDGRGDGCFLERHEWWFPIWVDIIVFFP